ncbi:hypothetical protein ABEB36_013055 [Hypothenemus hampei]|uniref:Uncharacterized protein n=1 Tax=Hypothenemus hampei TaxID=57062 RepID=A0ABD1E6M8_HYPHA
MFKGKNNYFSETKKKSPRVTREQQDRFLGQMTRRNSTVTHSELRRQFQQVTGDCLQFDDRQICVLRGRGRQARLQAARLVLKHNGGTVMFWGRIMLREKTPLILIQPTLTEQGYVDLILQLIIRLWRATVVEVLLFMEDNAPP